MFVTNGIQALVDHQPTLELSSSTLKDKKSIPSFEPFGRITLALNDNNWVADIHSTHESRLLFVALVKFFVLKYKGDVNNPEHIEKALSELSAYGFSIRRLSEVKSIEESFLHDFRFEKTIKRMTKKQGFVNVEVIDVMIRTMKYQHLRFDNYDEMTTQDFKNNLVFNRGNGLFAYRQYQQPNTLLFMIGDFLFLTNAIETAANVALIRSAIKEMNSVKDKFRGTSRMFSMVMVRTLANMCRNHMQIRSALIIRRKVEDNLMLIHRPFLPTEKCFDRPHPTLVNVTNLLKGIEQV